MAHMANAPLRVLVVEDNADAAKMLKVLLKGEGHETWIALDGPGAIEAARAHRPDVILLDFTLPGMTGAEVAMEFRCMTELAECRLVAVSGYGEEDLPNPSPFDRHFLKPVNHAALLEYLSRLHARPTPPAASIAVA
jgi:CheY-like chemotaxis protein